MIASNPISMRLCSDLIVGRLAVADYYSTDCSFRYSRAVRFPEHASNAFTSAWPVDLLAETAAWIVRVALLHKSNPVRKSSGQATEKVEGVGQRLRR